MRSMLTAPVGAERNTMTKREYERRAHLTRALVSLGIPEEQVDTLRRASNTLQRWAELECGTSDDWASRYVERDETTGKPFLVAQPHHLPKAFRQPIADREAGALRRIKAVLEPLSLHYWHQTDPRGCALYVSKEPLTDATYSRGIAVY